MNKELQQKIQQIRVNVEPALWAKIHKVANEVGQTPTGLARVLLEQYCRAYDRLGDKLVWRPRFAYYATEPHGESVRETGADREEP